MGFGEEGQGQAWDSGGRTLSHLAFGKCVYFKAVVGKNILFEVKQS